MLATGNIVMSLPVMALRNVDNEPFKSWSKGLFIGYFFDPLSTECSKICGIPQSSTGSVLNAIANVLFLSLLAILTTRAPLFIC